MSAWDDYTLTDLRDALWEHQCEIEEIEAEIKRRKRLERDQWPTRADLVAVFGAPINWPVVPREDESGRRMPV